MTAASPLRIVVLGYLVRGPLGGLAWHHLQYVVGLTDLGHDVVFIEDSDDYESCYDPSVDAMGTDPTYGLAFTDRAFRHFGLEDRWAYFDAHRNRWEGPLGDDAMTACCGADLLINVSGVNPVRSWWDSVSHRALVDTDPVFTQVRHLTTKSARRTAEAHTSFFSFAELFGSPSGLVPADGFPWRPTRQPIVPRLWPVSPPPADGPFTTVMQWDSYPGVHHDGQYFGMKASSFENIVELPKTRPMDRFMIALGSANAPRAQLAEQGWIVIDPLEVTRDPWSYQEFVKGSKAEFSVAKHGYVVSRSGWFSERSAGYLASGRPVVVEDTGFSEVLPSGTGLLPFSDLETAEAAIVDVNRRYSQHCSAAKEIADEWFDFRHVLPPMIDEAMSDS